MLLLSLLLLLLLLLEAARLLVGRRVSLRLTVTTARSADDCSLTLRFLSCRAAHGVWRVTVCLPVVVVLVRRAVTRKASIAATASTGATARRVALRCSRDGRRIVVCLLQRRPVPPHFVIVVVAVYPSTAAQPILVCVVHMLVVLSLASVSEIFCHPPLRRIRIACLPSIQKWGAAPIGRARVTIDAIAIAIVIVEISTRKRSCLIVVLAHRPLFKFVSDAGFGANAASVGNQGRSHYAGILPSSTVLALLMYCCCSCTKEQHDRPSAGTAV